MEYLFLAEINLFLLELLKYKNVHWVENIKRDKIIEVKFLETKGKKGEGHIQLFGR